MKSLRICSLVLVLGSAQAISTPIAVLADSDDKEMSPTSDCISSATLIAADGSKQSDEQPKDIEQKNADNEKIRGACIIRTVQPGELPNCRAGGQVCAQENRPACSIINPNAKCRTVQAGGGQCICACLAQ